MDVHQSLLYKVYVLTFLIREFDTNQWKVAIADIYSRKGSNILKKLLLMIFYMFLRQIQVKSKQKPYFQRL